MSSIIESVARGAKNQLTGTKPGELEAKQTARGQELIKQLVTGGLALGGGAGAAVALINYLKSLRDEDEVYDESRLNDDTLYIPSIAKAAAEGEGSSAPTVNRWLAPGVALAGGIISAGGAYALTQAVYNYLQKKRRQKMLDEAQNEALAASDIEIAKSAANMNFYDLVTAFPVAIPLLAALASGGVAYAALNKTFPTVTKTKSKYPKRIRQVSSTGAVEELPGNEEAEALKSAGIREMMAERDCEDSAYEFLMLMTDQLAHEKGASISLTSDLLNRVASQGIAEVVETYKQAGLDGLVDSLKGASDKPADQASKSVAAALICKSARLAPIARTLAAAEFQDLVPGIYASAVEHGPEKMDKFAGVASLMNMAFFRPSIMEKLATAAPVDPAIEQLMQTIAQQPGVADDLEDVLTSDAGGSLSDDSEGGGAAIADDREVRPDSEDPVDGFMEFDEGNPLLAPERAAAP